MERLQNEIKLKGLGTATLVQRNEKAAIYKRGENIFEVFKIKTRAEKIATFGDKQVTYPAGEIYPSNVDFGNWAWCYTNLASAEKKFESLS